MSEQKTPEKTDDKPKALVEVAPIVTEHSIKVGRKTIAYTATTGMMPLRDAKDEIDAEMFFMAYTLKTDNPDPNRPLTFAFNGGPGSASIWLHMGSLGPRRAVMNDDGTMPAPPFKLVDNEDTWLTDTDLVFIDPIGTGFSRAKDDEASKKYWNYQGDIDSVGEFIRLYLTRYSRWTSPLYLAGESYGTIRASGLAGKLVDQGIAFNGVFLISALLSYLTGSIGNYAGHDQPYTLFLPTFAATAWFHEKLPKDLQKRPVEEVAAEAGKWALSEYLLALAQGDELPEKDAEAIAKKLAMYTGLSEAYVKQSRLRVDIHRFCKELLRESGQSVGRIDSRFKGIDELAVSEIYDFDPSITSITPPFTSVFNDYVRNELGYSTDTTYETLSEAVFRGWTSDGRRRGWVETSSDFRKAFAKNPHMRVMINFGYYDLATPYYAIMYSVSHMGLDPEWRKNVVFAGYQSGHMMYLDTPSREQFTKDVREFYAGK